jgi:hypothetical protein
MLSQQTSSQLYRRASAGDKLTLVMLFDNMGRINTRVATRWLLMSWSLTFSTSALAFRWGSGCVHKYKSR